MLYTEELIAELHRENLSTYFILPLLKLNKKSFVAEDNFINSYLTRDGLYIFVKVKLVTFFMARTILHPQYLDLWTDKTGAEYYQFSIPPKWQMDVQTFINGKYSQLSNEAKQMIQQHSGLQYRVRSAPDNVPITDVRLLALEKSIAVRNMWEEHYGVRLDEKDELLSIQESKAFMDITLLVRKETYPPRLGKKQHLNSGDANSKYLNLDSLTEYLNLDHLIFKIDEP
jgi:hypothetical protein